MRQFNYKGIQFITIAFVQAYLNIQIYIYIQQNGEFVPWIPLKQISSRPSFNTSKEKAYIRSLPNLAPMERKQNIEYQNYLQMSCPGRAISCSTFNHRKPIIISKIVVDCISMGYNRTLGTHLRVQNLVGKDSFVE